MLLAHLQVARGLVLTTQPMISAPADFAFRYESKGCPFEVIDTFAGTYRIVTCGLRSYSS
jgi:hypothetical protein